MQRIDKNEIASLIKLLLNSTDTSEEMYSPALYLPETGIDNGFLESNIYINVDGMNPTDNLQISGINTEVIEGRPEKTIKQSNFF